jgi:hypothetical protein
MRSNSYFVRVVKWEIGNSTPGNQDFYSVQAKILLLETPDLKA